MSIFWHSQPHKYPPSHNYRIELSIYGEGRYFRLDCQPGMRIDFCRPLRTSRTTNPEKKRIQHCHLKSVFLSGETLSSGYCKKPIFFEHDRYIFLEWISIVFPCQLQLWPNVGVTGEPNQGEGEALNKYLPPSVANESTNNPQLFRQMPKKSIWINLGRHK